MATSYDHWKPLGLSDEDIAAMPASGHGVKVADLRLCGSSGSNRSARWLTASMVALGVLAGASAVVSYAAQYRMVFAAKGVAAGRRAGGGYPGCGGADLRTLGIALALHGRRAIRARVLNVGAVATSVAMNVLAAGHGWRDLAIWAMPPVAYALASDTADTAWSGPGRSPGRRH